VGSDPDVFADALDPEHRASGDSVPPIPNPIERRYKHPGATLQSAAQWRACLYRNASMLSRLCRLGSALSRLAPARRSSAFADGYGFAKQHGKPRFADKKIQFQSMH
jgi:hypothetical protein